ncbi:MAG: hypothetical protein AB7H77_04500 [Bdellovibrionales bacterium]
MTSADKKQAMKFFNNPIIIWILSILFLSVGGSIANESQQCRLEAAQIIDIRTKLGRELFQRREELYLAILNAKNRKDLLRLVNARQGQPEFIYSEYKNQTLDDLQEQFDRTEKKLGNAFPLGSKIEFEEIHAQASVGADRAIHGDGAYGSFNFHFGHPNFSQLREKDLPMAQYLAGKEMKLLMKHQTLSETVVPKCGYISSLLRMIGFEIPVAYKTNK